MYSKGYLAVKQHRARRKDEVEVLTRQVQQKLAQLQVLAAENEVLQVQEVVLQETLLANKDCTISDAVEAQQRSEEAAVAAIAAVEHGTAAVGDGGGAAGGSSCAGGASSSSGDGGGGGPAGGGSASSARSPAFKAVRELYCEYIKRMRARLQPDGTVRPLLLGEELYPPPGTIVPLYMSMTPEESFLVLVTNMETGEVVKELPAGAVARAAEHLQLRPEQEARIGLALDVFFASLEQLWEQRRELQRQLSEMLAEDGTGAAAATVVQREEVLSVLRANMRREDRMCSTMAFMILRLLDDVQRGTCIVHCWPFTPRFMQMCAIKLGKFKVAAGLEQRGAVQATG